LGGNFDFRVGQARELAGDFGREGGEVHSPVLLRLRKLSVYLADFAQRAGIHAVVEPFKPTVACLVMEHLVFRPAGLSLFLPTAKELCLVDDKVRFRAPFPKGLATGAVHHRQAAQLAELLRELWDFR
jgi:hypothetical protein